MQPARQLYSGQVAGTKVEVVGGETKGVTLRWVQALNTTAAVAYLQIFNKDGDDVTVGTTAPTLSIGVPASGVLSLLLSHGQKLRGQGLTLAGTTTRTGSTGAALDVNLGYE